MKIQFDGDETFKILADHLRSKGHTIPRGVKVGTVIIHPESQTSKDCVTFEFEVGAP
jgi:hypothetical protein